METKTLAESRRVVQKRKREYFVGAFFVKLAIFLVVGLGLFQEVFFLISFLVSFSFLVSTCFYLSFAGSLSLLKNKRGEKQKEYVRELVANKKLYLLLPDFVEHFFNLITLFLLAYQGFAFLSFLFTLKIMLEYFGRKHNRELKNTIFLYVKQWEKQTEEQFCWEPFENRSKVIEVD